MQRNLVRGRNLRTIGNDLKPEQFVARDVPNYAETARPVSHLLDVLQRCLLCLGKHGLGGHGWTNRSSARRRAIVLASFFLAAVFSVISLLATVRRNHLCTV